MAEAKRRELWTHTSHLLAMLASCHESKRGKKHRAEDYDPFAQLEKRRRRAKQRQDDPRQGFSALKSVFVDNGPINPDIRRE